ncbi:hypothetical protein SAMN05444003_0769 [Cognatiyoonia sediminum]|uniref:Uncharacterized protein n=1 Tax=Cognatiyoonia sediminum TaxID=1508389 RepID=A0A1M5MD11_9RHOB|nr:hypothetical protein [Cognatiyoonia sediminum]SHG75208.1 hypothetical protein SAMN05444003_0769 [Cognatiyoonia sediminum]
MTDGKEIDRVELVLGLARLIWESELSIGDYFDTVGIQPDDDLFTELYGIFTGWHNPNT